MEVAKTRFVLNSNLKVELAWRLAKVDATFLDGYSVLLVMLYCYIAYMRNCAELRQHLPSPHPATWIPGMSTLCLTDTDKSVSRSQSEMTEIKEPTKCVLCVN